MAPVILRLQQEPDVFETTVCLTAQHRQLLDSALGVFGVQAHIDLNLMEADQTLNGLTSRVFRSLDPVLVEQRPDWVLVQGDTTTTMATALAAFHRGVKVGHIEAGMRTYDLQRPFPEEMNRRVTGVVASAHFAPTRRCADALEKEGVPLDRIHLTGN